MLESKAPTTPHPCQTPDALRERFSTHTRIHTKTHTHTHTYIHTKTHNTDTHTHTHTHGSALTYPRTYAYTWACCRRDWCWLRLCAHVCWSHGGARNWHFQGVCLCVFATGKNTWASLVWVIQHGGGWHTPRVCTLAECDQSQTILCASLSHKTCSKFVATARQVVAPDTLFPWACCFIPAHWFPTAKHSAKCVCSYHCSPATACW